MSMATSFQCISEPNPSQTEKEDSTEAAPVTTYDLPDSLDDLFVELGEITLEPVPPMAMDASKPLATPVPVSAIETETHIVPEPATLPASALLEKGVTSQQVEKEDELEPVNSPSAFLSKLLGVKNDVPSPPTSEGQKPEAQPLSVRPRKPVPRTPYNHQGRYNDHRRCDGRHGGGLHHRSDAFHADFAYGGVVPYSWAGDLHQGDQPMWVQPNMRGGAVNQPMWVPPNMRGGAVNQPMWVPPNVWRGPLGVVAPPPPPPPPSIYRPDFPRDCRGAPAPSFHPQICIPCPYYNPIYPGYTVPNAPLGAPAAAFQPPMSLINPGVGHYTVPNDPRYTYPNLYCVPSYPEPSSHRPPPNPPINPAPSSNIPVNKDESSEEELLDKLRKQIEYYFSDENLVNDYYLKSRMDNNGWVNILVIAPFHLAARKIMQIVFHRGAPSSYCPTVLEILSIIKQAMSSSEVVEIQGEKIRKRNG